MHRDPRLYLDDILEAINKIRDYTAGMDCLKKNRILEMST